MMLDVLLIRSATLMVCTNDGAFARRASMVATLAGMLLASPVPGRP